MNIDIKPIELITNDFISNSFKEFNEKKIIRSCKLNKICNEITKNAADYDKILLEIGCGHGHWVTAYSEKNPNELCIGIDLISKRLTKANHKKNKRNLDNLVFIKAEACEWLNALTPEFLFDKIVLLFPDPWPKRRHNSRRIIQENFLNKLASKTKKGGLIFFRTDDKDYYNWSIKKITMNKRWQISKEIIWSFEEDTYFQSLTADYYSLIALHSMVTTIHSK